MSDFENLVAAIRKSIQELSDACETIRHAEDKLGGAIKSFGYAARGTSNHLPQVAIHALTTAQEYSHQAAQNIDDATNDIAEYVGYISEGSSSTPLHDRPSDAHTIAKIYGDIDMRPEDGDIRQFDPTQRNKAAFQGIRPYDIVETAEANLFFTDGEKWNDGPLRAHKLNLIQNAKGVIKEYASYRTIWHIEGAIAAYMREHGINEVAVYLNAQTYQYPDGCSKNLAKIAPKGSKIHLHYTKQNWVDGVRSKEYTMMYKLIIGTGEYLEKLCECYRRRRKGSGTSGVYAEKQ